MVVVRTQPRVVVVRVVVVRVVVVRTQPRVVVVRVVVVRVVVVLTHNFLSPAPRGKSAKESKAAMVLHQATSAAALLHGQLMTT